MKFFKQFASIVLLFLISSSSVMASSFKIDRFRKAHKHKISSKSKSATNTKLLEDDVFAMNALATSGIPGVSTVCGVFTTMMELYRNLRNNPKVPVTFKSGTIKQYFCSMAGVGSVYRDTITANQQHAASQLAKSKNELKEAFLNFYGEEHVFTDSDDDFKVCKNIKKKVKKLKKDGKEMLISQKVLDNLKMYLEDPADYKIKLEYSINHWHKYQITKSFLDKEGVLKDNRTLDGKKEFFEGHVRELLRKLQNKTDEGKNLLLISSEEFFGTMLNMECRKIIANGDPGKVSDADKVTIGLKMSGVWMAMNLIKDCVTEHSPQSRLVTALKLGADIAAAAIDICLSIFSWGLWKFAKMIWHAVRASWNYYYAYKGKKENDDHKYSKYLGIGMGYTMHIVLDFIPGVARRRLK